MLDDIIQNRLLEPSIEQIMEYMNEYTRDNWIKLFKFLDGNYKVNTVISYSKCSAMPGWNVKYKKGGKSLCTVYPDKEYFTVLLVLKETEISKIMEQQNTYSEYFIDIMKKSGALNGCKWLMIGVDDESVLEDIQRAVLLKNSKTKG